MLVLTRRTNEIIHIGEGIQVQVLRIASNRVRLGITAPSDVRILRDELEEDDSLDETVRVHVK